MIGVPLMLMCLSNLGRVLAESVRQTYARLCIRQSDHYKCTTVDGSGSGSSGSNGNNGNNSADLHRNTYHSADEKNEVNKVNKVIRIFRTNFSNPYDMNDCGRAAHVHNIYNVLHQFSLPLKLNDIYICRLKTVIYVNIMIFQKNHLCIEQTIVMVCIHTYFVEILVILSLLHTLHLYLLYEFMQFQRTTLYSICDDTSEMELF